MHCAPNPEPLHGGCALNPEARTGGFPRGNWSSEGLWSAILGIRGRLEAPGQPYSRLEASGSS
eukprot:8605130-Alexandrium_andersonii.AAC.1